MAINTYNLRKLNAVLSDNSPAPIKAGELRELLDDLATIKAARDALHIAHRHTQVVLASIGVEVDNCREVATAVQSLVDEIARRRATPRP